MKNQTGSALIISLLILLVMTMIGISAMNTSTMEEKMSANDRNQKLAFQNAESALVGAERDILEKDWFGDLNTKFTTAAKGYYNADNPIDYSVASNWDAAKDNCIDLVDKNACYTVEDIGIQNPLVAGDAGDPARSVTQISRITVRGTDNSGISGALLQTHLSKNLQQ